MISVIWVHILCLREKKIPEIHQTPRKNSHNLRYIQPGIIFMSILLYLYLYIYSSNIYFC